MLEGSHLAARDIIVVTFNYRLGALGRFSAQIQWTGRFCNRAQSPQPEFLHDATELACPAEHKSVSAQTVHEQVMSCYLLQSTSPCPAIYNSVSATEHKSEHPAATEHSMSSRFIYDSVQRVAAFMTQLQILLAKCCREITMIASRELQTYRGVRETETELQTYRGGNIHCVGTAFEGNIHCVGTAFESNILCCNIHSVGTAFEGNIHCVGTAFEGNIHCVGTAFEGNIHCAGTAFEGNIHCVGTAFEGNMHCVGTAFEGNILCCNIHSVGTAFEGNIHCVGTAFEGNIHCVGTA
ncbi:hypothetical protein RRG08_056640, partial [Elysia crispata]